MSRQSRKSAISLLGFVLGIAAFSSPAFAAASTGGQSTTTASNVEKPGKGEKTSGGDLTATYSGSALETSDQDRVSTLELEVAPWIATSKNTKLDGYLDLSRDMNNYGETTIADARVGFLHNPIRLSKVFQYRPKAVLYLPADAKKREVNSFLGAVGFGNRILFETGILSGYYQLGLTKNVYRYETTGDSGESNPSWSLGNVLKMGLSVDRFSLDVTGSVTQKWTFEATPSSSFEVSEELGATLSKVWAVSVGHSNGDSLFLANGSDSNFSFANGNTSKFYLSVNYTL